MLRSLEDQPCNHANQDGRSCLAEMEQKERRGEAEVHATMRNLIDGLTRSV
jgi:hypothetical protein